MALASVNHLEAKDMERNQKKNYCFVCLCFLLTLNFSNKWKNHVAALEIDWEDYWQVQAEIK